MVWGSLHFPLIQSTPERVCLGCVVWLGVAMVWLCAQVGWFAVLVYAGDVWLDRSTIYQTKFLQVTGTNYHNLHCREILVEIAQVEHDSV